jgi:alpha-tubulin suppressor-like RCC1 family protein
VAYIRLTVSSANKPADMTPIEATAPVTPGDTVSFDLTVPNGSRRFVIDAMDGAMFVLYRGETTAVLSGGTETVTVNTVVPVFLVVSAQGWHNVAVKADGSAWAWGDNFFGQLGDGTTTQRNAPVRVAGAGGVGSLAGVRGVSGGLFHTIALMSDGSVWCWGNNDWGQLGMGDNVSRTSPAETLFSSGGGATATSSSAGDVHTVVLKSDGTVWSWGGNQFGQIGIGTADSAIHSGPSQVVGTGGAGFLTAVAAIAVGGTHTVALRNDNTVWTWGQNQFGQLGLGTVDGIAHPSPAQVPGLTGVVAISARDLTTVALKADGTVWTWGANGKGQLGNGSTVDSPSPVRTGALTGIGFVSAGGLHTLAVEAGTGAVWACGANQYGQLGIGAADTAAHAAPAQVVGTGGSGIFTDVLSVSSGYGHSIALKKDRTVWAWGDNFFGQLGDGTTVDRSAPVPVSAF